MYYKVPERKIVFFDVDSTLVFAPSDIENDFYTTPSKAAENNIEFNIVHEHILKIKEFKARGHTVVVWSAGGADWAETVVKKLELEEHVDLVISKPDWYFDDKPSSDWLKGKRCYANNEYMNIQIED